MSSLSAPMRALGDEPNQTRDETATASAADLAAVAKQLTSEDASRRERAYSTLASLPEEQLDAISVRVGELAGRELDTDEAYRVLAKFRHAIGSRRADDLEIDLAPGIPPTLAVQRDVLTVAMAERVALLRSLERIGTTAAYLVAADLLAHGYTAWRWEAKRVLRRHGDRLLAALLRARTHKSPDIRDWAARGLAELKVDGPGSAVQGRDPAVLAAVLRAYAHVKEMDAMPVIASFVDSHRDVVRRAARESITEFGRNAIWQLRKQYRLVTGEDAARGWSAERTRRLLFDAIDERRLLPARTAFEEAVRIAEKGDLRAAKRGLDEALRIAPRFPERDRMAAIYASYGAMSAEASDYAEAEQAYRRARYLSTDSKERARLEAASWFARAERQRRAGFLDLHAYERVLALMPEHEEARERIEEWSDGELSGERPFRLLAGVLAALLLLFVGIVLLRGASSRAPSLARRDETSLDTLPG